MEEDKSTTYTVKEVSKFLSLHYTKVYKLISAGQMKAINISTGDKRPNWRIPRSYLLEFMEERKNGQNG